MGRKTSGAYGALLGLSGLFAAAAVVTLLPNPGASWANVLGYRSVCTFTPISTALCALLAGATCTVRARLLGPRRGERRSWLAPAAVGVLLVLVIGFSLPAWARAKADAGSGASPAARIEKARIEKVDAPPEMCYLDSTNLARMKKETSSAC